MDNNDQIINLLDSFANQNKSNQNFQMSKEEYSKFRQNLILSLNSNFLKRFSIIDQVFFFNFLSFMIEKGFFNF